MTPISQSNIYLILPLKIGILASRLAEERDMPLPQAVHYIYRSALYEKLAKEDTKYWQLSPVDLYRELV